jgi:hypothetical protein
MDQTVKVLSTHATNTEELVLSGTYECTYRDSGTRVQLLTSKIWILVTVWELLTLCLAVWIVIKHFRGLRRPATQCSVRDCFTILIQTHVFYFVAWVCTSNVCFPAEILPILALPLFLVSTSACCLPFWYVNQAVTDIYIRPLIVFCRSHILLELKSILACFKSSYL